MALGFFLLEPRGVVRAALAGAALRAARFTFLRSSVSVMLLVFAMLVGNSSLSSISKLLQALQLGELLHQLLHAVLCKLYCNLGIVPIPFAPKDRSFAVFGVPDAGSIADAGRAFLLRDLQFGAIHLLSARSKKAGDVVDGAFRARIRLDSELQTRLWFWSAGGGRSAGALVLVLVVVVPFAAVTVVVAAARTPLFVAAVTVLATRVPGASAVGGTAEVFDKARGDFFQEARSDACLGHV